MNSESLDDTSSHRHTWDVLPWLVNGSAAAHDVERATRHLAECASCRDELAFQQAICAGVQVEEKFRDDGGAGLAGLFQRIDQQAADLVRAADGECADTTAAPRRAVSGWRTASRAQWSRYQARVLTAAVVAQSVGLVLLGVLVLGQQSASIPAAGAAYQTLSASAAPSSAVIRFVAAPGMSVGALQSLLKRHALQIVDSRQDSAVFGLAPVSSSASVAGADTARDDQVAALVAALRAEPGVLLVEPILSAASGAARELR